MSYLKFLTIVAAICLDEYTKVTVCHVLKGVTWTQFVGCGWRHITEEALIYV